jgi:hypothetical protein
LALDGVAGRQAAKQAADSQDMKRQQTGFYPLLPPLFNGNSSFNLDEMELPNFVFCQKFN